MSFYVYVKAGEVQINNGNVIPLRAKLTQVCLYSVRHRLPHTRLSLSCTGAAGSYFRFPSGDPENKCRSRVITGAPAYERPQRERKAEAWTRGGGFVRARQKASITMLRTPTSSREPGEEVADGEIRC